jgi:hypothetical protein
MSGFETLFKLECRIIFGINTIGILHAISPIHIAELIKLKGLSSFSDSSVLKNYWSAWVLNFYDNGDYDKERTENNDSDERYTDIHRSFYEKSPEPE